MKYILLFAIPFLLVMLALYQAGLVSMKAAQISVGGIWGLLSWWKGKFSLLTGTVSRNFLVSPRYHRLSVEIEPSAGDLELEVRTRAGVLYDWRGAAPAAFQIELSGVRKLHVTVRGNGFKGRFAFALVS